MDASLAMRRALPQDGPSAIAAAVAVAELSRLEPELVEGFQEALPRAAGVVAGRVLGAVYREGLIDAVPTWSGGQVYLPRSGVGFIKIQAQRYGFDRIEVTEQPQVLDPAQLLVEFCGERFTDTVYDVGAELADAVVNLALAFTRRDRLAARLRTLAVATHAHDTIDLALATSDDVDEQCVFFEQLATEGHNLHPCGRTRSGWSVADLLAHDLESEGTEVSLIGVTRELHMGDDIGTELARHYPRWNVGLDPHRYALTPVHAWQLQRVITSRYADLIADGSLVPVPHTAIPARPTAAIRTVLLAPGTDGRRRYLKLSLDIQVTSTRRSISAASTHNGPILSSVLERLLADEQFERVLLMAEPAGSAVLAPDGRVRDLAAITRTGLRGRLGPGEVPVPALALPAQSPLTGTTILAELVQRYARTRALPPTAYAATAFLDEYALLLLPPLVSLAARYGIAIEAHLQNCVPTFVDGVPCRLAIRDLAGLRVHPPRLDPEPPLWPGSVIVTDDADVMRAKLAYTALQAHLGELILRLVAAYGVDERRAWSGVRSVLARQYAQLASDTSLTERAAADHAFLTAPLVPHKALLRMRLTEAGDIYVPVANPLN